MPNDGANEQRSSYRCGDKFGFVLALGATFHPLRRMNLTFGKERCFPAQINTIAVLSASKLAAARRCLIRHQLGFAQLSQPYGHDVTMSTAANRIFGDVAFGCKAAGDAVIPVTAGGCMENKPIKLAHEFLVGLEVANLLLGFQYTDQVGVNIGF